jgi:opacity protein-like surface antigen
VNGSGFGFNAADEAFDNNTAKDPYFRLAKNFNDNTIGVFGYLGNNQVFTDSVNYNQKDRFLRVGGDINWNFSKLNVRTTLLYGKDNNFNGLKNKTSFYGGFVEGNYNATDRLVLIGRYDMTKLADAEAATDEESGKTTWAVTPGFQYLILPNIKIGLEYQVRQKREQDRAIALLHFAL